VLNGGNNHPIGPKRGCETGVNNVSEMGADNRSVGQIGSNEFDTMVDWRGFDGQINPFA